MHIGQNLKDQIMEKFNTFQDEAKKTLLNGEATQEKLNAVFAKAEKLNINTGPINKVYQDILLLIQIVKAYITKEYREIPIGSIVAIFAALIYFLSPIDIIFDYIPGVGYVDDMFVLGLVLKQLDSDLQKFRDWQDNH
ncbi:YkvA family protein [Desulfitobacterium sp. THU1]|uniref:YkvA family protein n=1 Tax=Desulfitobacterium sp. THU1 TaxID=3138072 RepID=UPI00311FE816